MEATTTTRKKTTRKPAAGAKTAKSPTLLIGMDLGTSRTAIASNTGHRLVASTYVGRPKDVVGEKLFGKRLLFGDEALNNRMAVELVRPLEHGVIRTDADDKSRSIDAVHALFHHVVSLVRPIQDDVIYGVIGTPARASIESKQAIIAAARGVFDAVMIVSEPFCVAYGLDILTDALVLDIGAGTMDLCRMRGTLPADDDQVTINKAGDFIDNELYGLIKSKYTEAQFSINMIRTLKERHGYVSHKEERIEVEFTVDGRPRMFDVTRELKQACQSIVPDLTKAVYTLIGSFDPEFQKRLRDNVIVCGGGSQMTGLRDLIEQALDQLGGGRVAVVDEPVYAGANGALKIADEMPDTFWEHIGA